MDEEIVVAELRQVVDLAFRILVEARLLGGRPWKLGYGARLSGVRPFLVWLRSFALWRLASCAKELAFLEINYRKRLWGP